MKIVFQDPTFSLQLLRVIGETYYNGADIGECISTAYRIKEGDFESWHQEWLKTAERVNKYANESLAAGHTVSAREAYLRACNYYRAAEFFLINPMIQEFKLHGERAKSALVKQQLFFHHLLNL